jgi:multicomponent Na+:H+ antiporter subunit E
MTDGTQAAIARWAGFVCLWLVISRLDLAELLIGAVTAAGATWASLHLLPPGPGRLRPAALARLGLRFVRQSAIAGADVARRALDPRLPLRPGFVRVPLRVAPGVARNAFCALASLMPGSLPAGSDNGALRVHCLDLGQDVPAQMSTEETIFLAALGRASGDG